MVVRNVFFVTQRYHLFFDCPFARLICRVVYFTFNIPPPANVTNMFGNWLNGVEKSSNANIRIDFCALVWALWNCRNDMVFNKVGTAHFLQVIRMATFWIREWSYLLPEVRQAHMDFGCNRLETVAWDIYNQGGWRLTRRLHDA